MHIQGQTGELRMKLQIKRAATGKVETVELVGRATEDEVRQLGLAHLIPQDGEKGADDGSHS